MSDFFDEDPKSAPLLSATRDDEQAVGWTGKVGALPDPVKPVQVEFGTKAPMGLFAPQEQQAAIARRNLYWSALARKGREAVASHEQMRVALIGYRAANRDPNLGALGVFPEHGDMDATTLIGHQRVPERGGKSIDDHFTKDNEVRRSDDERDAEKATAAAIQGGNDHVDVNNRQAGDADTQLEIAKRNRDKTRRQIETLKRNVENAALELGAFEEDLEVADQREEIARLRADAEELREDIERASQVLALGFHLGNGIEGMGDGVEKVGEIAGGVAAHKNDGKIIDAEKTIQGAREIGSRFKLRRMKNDLIDARKELSDGHEAIKTSNLEIRRALSGTRTAYSQLGTTVASAAPTSVESQQTIGGLIAAIPLARDALERARNLEEGANVPAHDPAAEMGLGMAVSHQHPSVREFLRACTEIQTARHDGRRDEEKWMKRLNSMMALKHRLVGKVAGE